MSYVVVTSDGEVHEFDNVDDFIDCVDAHGPEVVETFEPRRSSRGSFVPLNEIVRCQA